MPVVRSQSNSILQLCRESACWEMSILLIFRFFCLLLYTAVYLFGFMILHIILGVRSASRLSHRRTLQSSSIHTHLDKRSLVVFPSIKDPCANGKEENYSKCSDT